MPCVFLHGSRHVIRYAPSSSVRLRSASIFFICAISDNVPGIVRILYNCLITTNNVAQRPRESPPLTVLWLSPPEPDGGGSTTPSGQPRRGCLLAAEAAPALPTCRGTQGAPHVLEGAVLISEVLSGVSVLQCAASVLHYWCYISVKS